MTLPQRPWLRPEAAPRWRDERRIDIGDGSRRTVLEVLPAEVAWMVSLRGDRDLAHVISAARAAGINARRATALLATLDAAGTLDDAGHVPQAIRAASRADRDGLAGVVAACRHIHGGARRAADAVDRRSATTIGLHGSGRLADAIAASLTSAGIGTIVRGAPAQRSEPLACHILADQAHPDVLEDHGALALDLPHLPVVVHAARADVGPLVLPGHTGCLTCGDLHRRDADPDWPRVAVQWAHRRPDRRAVDPVLTSLAAGLATAQVTAWLDGGVEAGRGGATSEGAGGPGIPALGATLRLTLPGGWPDVVPRPAHPLCGCRWSLGNVASGHDDARGVS